MSTTWTRTAQEICRDALEHLGAVGDGEAVSAGDLNIALRGLDAVLKELPLSGYSWPKLSGDVALVWSEGTPQTIALPADYFAYPSVRTTALLTQIPHSTWVAMTDRDVVGDEPTHFYISPDKVLHFWPVPTVDPEATLQYQRIVDDAAATSAPDVPQYAVNALGYGVANEIKLKFGANPQRREEIRLTWEQKKAMVLANAIQSEPISFSVDG